MSKSSENTAYNLKISVINYTVDIGNTPENIVFMVTSVGNIICPGL